MKPYSNACSTTAYLWSCCLLYTSRKILHTDTFRKMTFLHVLRAVQSEWALISKTIFFEKTLRALFVGKTIILCVQTSSFHRHHQYNNIYQYIIVIVFIASVCSRSGDFHVPIYSISVYCLITSNVVDMCKSFQLRDDRISTNTIVCRCDKFDFSWYQK